MATTYPYRSVVNGKAVKTLRGNNLAAGQTAFVTGKIVFSRLSTPYEGEALARFNADRHRRNPQLQLLSGPLYRVVLSNVEIVEDGNPANDELRTFIKENVFRSDTHPEYGDQFNKDFKSSYPPQVFVKQDDGTYVQLYDGLESDLATGVDVTLVLQTYDSGSNSGSSVRQVFINETGPVRYYTPGVDKAVLAKAGLTIAGRVTLTQPKKATVADNAAAEVRAEQTKTADVPDSTDVDGLLD